MENRADRAMMVTMIATIDQRNRFQHRRGQDRSGPERRAQPLPHRIFKVGHQVVAEKTDIAPHQFHICHRPVPRGGKGSV